MTVISLPARSARPVEVVRPPRLTFAGRCIWCGIQDCQDTECVDLHEVSQWAVCRQCDGTGLAFSGPQGCTCAFGLIHVAPAVSRLLGHSAKGEPVTEEGHWSSYNDRTYYAFLHPAEGPKPIRAVAPVEGEGRVVA